MSTHRRAFTIPSVRIIPLVLLPFLIPGPVTAQAALEHEGAAALGLALRRLGTTKRVLMIGAHPDDENTAVLSALALRDGADVAYLSLTRGEGGQNLIGPELQEGLGLIRSEELLAARRLDGAKQFFTRAYDYGFSRSADEAFRHWPRDLLLADVVEIVRKYRPHIILSVFSGTPADGHGQHQAAGIMARDAFRFAGDPTAFPEQITRGLAPHSPAYLFQAAWRPRGDEPLTLAVGEFDGLLGRSHYQIAMASRSRHRSQDMGQPEPIGPRQVSLNVLAGKYPGGGSSIFTGLDTTLSTLAASTISPTTATPPDVAALRRYETQVSVARESFNPLAASDVVPALVQARVELLRADAIIGRATADLRREIDAERADLDDAIAHAAGVVLDAQADDPTVVPGQELQVTLTLWNGGRDDIHLDALEPALPAGWRAVAQDRLPGEALAPGAVARRRFNVTVAPDAEPTEAYYLRAPRRGDLYTWPVDPDLRGLPFEPPRLRATAEFTIRSHAIRRNTEVVRVEIDKAQGERRRPILVVPTVNVAMTPTFGVVPLASAASSSGDAGPQLRDITIVMTSEATVPLSGTVRLIAPAGWVVAPASAPVRFERTGEQREARFELRPPQAVEPGKYPVRAVFEATDGKRYDRGYVVIEYPHTRPRTLYRDAAADFSAFPVAVANGLDIGYVEGAGDDGALALRQLGVNVVPIDAEMLALGDLSQFDAIVLGIRAYEVRPDLIARNDRILEYARNGGTVIAQYNKYEYVDGAFAPYPLTMARPHGRVTDENAHVRLLDPAHQLLSWPNRITEADFTGWAHERGLYFADTWDDRFSPLLEMADPGQEPLRGSLLVARAGQGWYVYTGLALFRQYPEGIPGAYRLLANLISMGKRPRS